MASTKSGRSGQRALKQKIKKLKAAGLYSGNLRKAPTDYAKRLVRKYADVAEGRAKVVTVKPQRISSKNKGVKVARQEAENIASQFGSIMRAKLNKIIVKVSHPNEKVGISQKEKKVFTTIRRGTEKEVHEYVKLDNGRLPPLEKNQAYGLPVRRKGGELGYIMRATEEEILALANEYEFRPKHMYQGATGHIQIVYGGNVRRHRKRKAAKASNVIPFPKRQK